ncbi:embryogenesis-associated protein EMB8 [Sesamum indicum]|uniref:Embryogenesis-associated protein EMB8 n=1 Tax=Sesamum indicum TaxID=4182 RepID=A0A6I9UGQ0_SESIN|nr:embryogenesis-associated protein EMB8 [Sesamum indicum]
MDCSEAILEKPAVAYEFLFKSALAIPLSHYLVGLLLLCLVLLYNYLEFHFFQDLFTGFRGGPVFLTYNPSSEIYHGVVSKCRTLHGRYLATPWLSSPHFQTSFVNFFGRPPVFTYRRQMFHASDGGIFALDWLMHSDVAVSEAAFQNNHAMSKDDATPIVVMVPGLTSDSASPYMKHLVFYTAKQGWNVVVSNHRGLGGVSVTSDCFYNAGWTEDVREVITYLHQEYSAAPLFVVGTSIGANILVKYLGEEGENVPIAGAAAVCSPWDLLIGSRFICRRLIQKLYDRALTIGLQGYAQLHETRYSRLANWDGIKKSRSIRDFDTHATCLVGNYETVDTYYRRCSSSSFIGQVSVPLLCISALDDPVCTREAIPWDECRANKNVVLATTQHGGHLAFFEGLTGSGLWWVRAVNEFLAALLASPFMHTQKKAESLAPHSALTQSSIDQGPYLNVADGMVAAMVNERTDGAINETAEENKDHGQTNQIASGTENHPFTSGRKSNSAVDASQSSEDGVDSKGSGIVARCLYQLSRQNNKSVWLLAYIAIVSTWPLVGAALGFFFGRKLKRALPGKPPK